MKKIVLLLLSAAMFAGVSAQEKGKIRVGLDGGIDFPNAGVGLGGGIDIRYNIKDNINVGLKFAGDAMAKDLYSDELNLTASATAAAISSTLVTGDYYFSKGESLFAPFVGGGFGFYKIANVKATVTGDQVPEPPTDFTNYTPDTKFGALIRGGFELGHVRLGLEYNIIPKSSVYEVSDGSVGLASNSFLKLSLGFYLGGGKWRKL